MHIQPHPYTQTYIDGESLFKMLPASAPGELAFKLCQYGSKERIYHIHLPTDGAQAVRTCACPSLPGSSLIVLPSCTNPAHTSLAPHPHGRGPRQGAVKELLTSDRWKIWGRHDTPTTLVADYQGVYLPSPVAPFLLEAAAPTPPLASPDTIAAALQPHVMDLILRFAINTTLAAM
jgi:hypothetical protein